MEIKTWRDLKIGQHIRLNCGCIGFVAEVCLTGSDEEGQLGFLIKYTSEKCPNKKVTRWGYRNSYSRGYGPYGNFFNYGDQETYGPFIETPAPSWWTKFESGPDRRLQNLRRERDRRFQEKWRAERK